MPPTVPVGHLNEALLRGYKRAEELADRLAVILEPILRKAGEDAADAFVRKATDPLTAAADWSSPAPDEILDVESLVQTLRTKTDPVRTALVESTMRPVLESAGVSFDATNPLTARVLAQSGSQVTGIAETTQVNVMRAIRHGYEQGLSIPDTATAIRAGMAEASVARSVLIARTEMAGAANGGSLAAARIVSETSDGEEGDAGGALYKEWLTAPGAPNPRHEDYDNLDGQTVHLDDYFTVGEDQLQYPGDPDGSPDEVCNCRCAMAYTDDPGELAQEGGGVDGGTQADDQTDSGGVAVPQALPAMPVEAPPVADLAAGDNVSVPGEPPVPAEYVEKINDLNILGFASPTPGVTDRVLGEFTSTQEKFKLENGSYTPEREKVHDEIVKAHFANRARTEGRPVAYFTAGGGASGKSGALFRVGDRLVRADELESATTDVVIINPDDVKEMLPEYKQLHDLNDPYAASAVHEESSDLAKRITAEAIRRGQSYLLDTTGTGAKFGGKIADAAAGNYETHVTLVSIPTNLAVERSIIRGDRSGRYVSIDALKDAHSGSSAAIDIWRDADYVNEWRVYDNTQGLNLVAEKTAAGRTVIHDPESFDAIRAKGAQAGQSAPTVLTTPKPPAAPVTVRTATPPTIFHGGAVERADLFDVEDRARVFSGAEGLSPEAEDQFAVDYKRLETEITNVEWESTAAQNEAYEAATRVGADQVSVLRDLDGKLIGIVSYNPGLSRAELSEARRGLEDVTKRLEANDYDYEYGASDREQDTALRDAYEKMIEREKSNPEIGVNHLASTGTEPGTGARLMLEIAKVAAAQGKGVGLNSLTEAAGFYERIGMTQDPGTNDFHWTPDEARAFAAG